MAWISLIKQNFSLKFVIKIDIFIVLANSSSVISVDVIKNDFILSIFQWSKISGKMHEIGHIRHN